MAATWPLVGRREELQLVVETLNDPGGAAVVVAGVAGVGKSRVLAEALKRLSDEGRVTRIGVATHAAKPIPFGAIAHMLPSSLPQGASVNLLRAVEDALVEPASNRAVLAIDDAHLLDDASAALVHHLAVEGRTDLLLTVRTGETTPDPVVGLWKDGFADRVELQPLSRGEVEEVTTAVLGSQVEGTTMHRFWELTLGNVLYLHELVVAGLESGVLRSQRGVWRWSGDVTLGSRLQALLETRLEGLTRGERAALEIVAAGEPVEASFVEASVPPATLERLERRGLVHVIVDGRRLRVRAGHPLYGEAVREATPVTRTRSIVRDLAAALADTGRRPDDPLRLASWRLEAGETDIDLFVKAGRLALSQGGFELAERLARAAVRDGAGFMAGDLLAQVLMRTGRLDEADRLLASLGDSAATEEELKEAVVLRLWNLHQGLGRPDEAWRILRNAERMLTDPGLKAELLAFKGKLLHLDGRLDEALDVVLPLARSDDVVDDTRVIAGAMAVWGLNLTGRNEEAIRLVGSVLPVAARVAERNALAGSLVHPLRGHRAAALVFMGRLDEAEAALSVLYEEALARGDQEGQAGLAAFLGLIDRLRGQPRSAARWLRESVGVSRTVDPAQRLRRVLGELAHCLALVGDTEGAREALEEAEAALASVRIFDWQYKLGRVWTAAAMGERSAAAALALQTADLCAGQGHRVGEAAALHDAARLGGAHDAAPRLAELAVRIDGPMVHAYTAHAAALATCDAAALDRSSLEFEAIGAILLAAEAAAEAAAIYRVAGARGGAMAASARAASLASTCEGARTPALADLEPLPLTRREREIATMAARGLSNREIAERLVVSIRTVDNHLHSAYTKLGIRRRRELASILQPPP